MNILWSSMLLLGIAYGALQGRMPEVTDGVIQATREAVVLAVSLVGVTGFWAGLMEIAKKAGVIDGLVKRMGPVMRFLFPEVPEDHPAMRAAGMNMICNVFGLGAAATPAGLETMERFEQLEEERRKIYRMTPVGKMILLAECRRLEQLAAIAGSFLGECAPAG